MNSSPKVGFEAQIHEHTIKKIQLALPLPVCFGHVANIQRDLLVQVCFAYICIVYEIHLWRVTVLQLTVPV